MVFIAMGLNGWEMVYYIPVAKNGTEIEDY